MSSHTVSKLSDLLRKAEAAYKQEMAGKEDPENWPEWYARWLMKNGLHHAVETDLSTENLKLHLNEIGKRYKQSTEQTSWPDYAASQLANAL